MWGNDVEELSGILYTWLVCRRTRLSARPVRRCYSVKVLAVWTLRSRYVPEPWGVPWLETIRPTRIGVDSEKGAAH